MSQFQKVNSSRGAPMGRSADGFLETDMPRFVRLFRVRLDSGGYDDGGAYWGFSRGEYLWCAIDDDGNQQFTRAVHRTKAAFLLDIPAPAVKVRLDDWSGYGMALIDGRAPMPADKTKADVIEWLQRCGAAMGQAK
jgi:hypothetical protein